MDLALVHNRNDLARLVGAANGLEHASAAAIASTALMISEIQSFVDDNAPRSSFDAEKLVLFPGTRPLPDAAKDYLHRLARAAEAAAAAKSCSSILAGQGSESDDTGDVGLWLGNGDFQTAELVLGELGLSEWAQSGEIAEGGVLPHTEAELDKLLGELKDTFRFRVVSTAMTGGIVLFFVVGRVDGGWGGLVGIGTWT